MEYNKYNLLLDPNDKEDQVLIKFLASKHGKKRKDSYTSIIKKALILLMAAEKGK